MEVLMFGEGLGGAVDDGAGGGGVAVYGVGEGAKGGEIGVDGGEEGVVSSVFWEKKCMPVGTFGEKTGSLKRM